MADSKPFDALRAILEGKKVDLSAFSQKEIDLLMQVQDLKANYEHIENDNQNIHGRLEQLLDVLVEFAQFNFSMEIPISEEADELDGIALGLQTLGQEIEYYQRELSISNDNLLEAQKIAKIGSWVVDLDHKKMDWSDEMYCIYEMEKGDSAFSELQNRYSHDDYEMMKHLYERAVNYHEPYHITLPITVEGRVKYVDARAKPVFENGELKKIMGTCLDVTDRHVAQKKLEILNQELEEKVAERTKDLEGFSYSVSHDLRAPLRSIIGFSNILTETHADLLGDEGKRHLDIIIRNASKMSTLIEELLTFSRVGITVPHFQEIDTNDLIQSIWQDSLQNFVHKEAVQVDIDDLPQIFGAPSLLNQVFANLFSNALKYSSKNEKIEIKIRLHQKENDTLTIAVKDNGCGFNMNYHEKLFGVFQRLHSEDEYPGTGVGLALVKRIIDKHQGKIWAESAVNEGSTFYVTLPTVHPSEMI